MNVRDAEIRDFSAIKRIHEETGLNYTLPDLQEPLFFVRKVATDDTGRVVGACFLRLTAETYLWLDPEAEAKEKVNAMTALQPEVLAAAWKQGIDDIEARIPETIERRFQKRLKQLGWVRNRDGWHPWTIQTCVTP